LRTDPGQRANVAAGQVVGAHHVELGLHDPPRAEGDPLQDLALLNGRSVCSSRRKCRRVGQVVGTKPHRKP
jgi:hypothetical protein